MRQNIERIIYDAVTPVAVTSSTDATPIVVTATAHGLSTGDRVLIFGHTTNVAANGIFKVTRLSSSTFSLQDEFDGSSIAGSGAGAGSSGLLVPAPPIINATDFISVVFQIGTTGTATTTVKVAGSSGRLLNQANTITPRKDLVNFGATVTASNPYSFLQVIDLLDNSPKDGGTGIVVAGADIQKMFEINTDAVKFVTFIPISWTQGAITLKAICYYE